MTKNTRNKILLYSFLGLLAFGIFFMIENVFPYIGIKPWRMTNADAIQRYPQGCLPENFGLKGKKMTIRTADGLNLSAWLIESNLDTTYATLVQLHGISNCKESDLPRAQVLADSGYASVLLDLRAHGESDGDFCTFGYYEKNDLKAVADTLSKMQPGTPLAIWGASLGGAIALQAMAIEPRFVFGVVESTFDEYPKVFAEYGKDYLFGFQSDWLFGHVLRKSGEIAKFDPYAVMPVEAAAKIDRPVLFIHGDKDAKIPKEFNQRNFEAVQNAGKEWVLVPGGGHSNLWVKDGPHLKTVLCNFLRARR